MVGNVGEFLSGPPQHVHPAEDMQRSSHSLMSCAFGKPLAVVIHSLPGPNTAYTAATSQDERPARIYLDKETNPHCNHTLLSYDLL